MPRHLARPRQQIRLRNLEGFVNVCGLLFPFALFPFLLSAQSSGIPLHAPTYHILDRLDITSGVNSPIHPELKFFPRQDTADYALVVDTLSTRLSWRDYADY